MIHVIHMIRRRHPMHGDRILLALVLTATALLAAGALLLFF